MIPIHQYLNENNGNALIVFLTEIIRIWQFQLRLVGLKQQQKKLFCFSVY